MENKAGLKTNSSLFCDCQGPLKINKSEINDAVNEAAKAYKIIIKGESDLLFDGENLMTGWVDLPEIYLNEKSFFINEIISAGKTFLENIDVFLSLGIGGSYLGIEATINALLPSNFNLLDRDKRGCPQIFFLGNHLSCEEISEILNYIKNKKIGINVISKSGSTTETAVVFRLCRNLILKTQENENKYIIAITDAKKGALRELAEKVNYNKPYFSKKSLDLLSVPDNIGGRYSITSPVGLFSLAVAGIDIRLFLKGAMDMQNEINNDLSNNPAFIRAATRVSSVRKGAKIENIVSSTKALYGLSKWSRQLFPESEGKNNKGLWVSSGLYTEDAHSIGQLISAGERNIIETYLTVQNMKNDMKLPYSDTQDGMSYLDGRNISLSFINNCALKGLKFDHYNRGVPIFEYIFPEINEYVLGQFFQCEMNACLISCIMQGINGVIQPDVEGYKNAMYAMLEKPGYETEKIKIENFFKN